VTIEEPGLVAMSDTDRAAAVSVFADVLAALWMKRQRRPGRRATAYRTSPSAPVIGRPDLPMTAHLIMVKASRAGNRRR